jgi:hypothetical protein
MGITPIQIELACDRRWVCAANAPCGWEFDDVLDEVTAYPTEDNSGPSQTIRVNACQPKDPSASINFDFGPDAAETLQSMDVIVNQEDKTTSLDNTIRTLENSQNQAASSEHGDQQKADKNVIDAVR